MPLESAAAPAAQQSPSCSRVDRVASVCQVVDLEQARRARGISLRGFAAENDVPRSTLQDRVRAVQDDGLPEQWRPFLESEVGLGFVQRLLVSVLVVFVLRGGSSVELVAEFFEALHLRRLVATSPTSLRRVLSQVLEHTQTWGQAQFARLAPTMAPQDVVLALDENFHWRQMLLVAMDVATGFVFCERSSETRDGETWEKAVRESTTGFNVCLRAISRDGAEGLRHCATRLGVISGPDVFHLQCAVCKATARPMAQRVVRAQQAVEASKDECAAVHAERERDEAAPRGPGRPPDWDARERRAQAAVVSAERHATTMAKERAAMQASIRALGDAHHPVDLVTGEAVSAEQTRARIEHVVTEMQAQVERAGLGQRAAKALRAVTARQGDLAAIVAWWYQELRRRLLSLSLPEGDVAWIIAVLVPALYVHRRIELGRNENERTTLKALWASLRAKAMACTSPWSTWSANQRQCVWDVVQSCVRMFPRSTSMLEGHNGQDSLCQHQHHQLSEDFRKARIVVRNYVVQRADGTTAAERLFGGKPDDLIEHLCSRIKLPGRGRIRDGRPKPPALALTG